MLGGTTVPEEQLRRPTRAIQPLPHLLPACKSTKSPLARARLRQYPCRPPSPPPRSGPCSGTRSRSRGSSAPLGCCTCAGCGRCRAGGAERVGRRGGVAGQHTRGQPQPARGSSSHGGGNVPTSGAAGRVLNSSDDTAALQLGGASTASLVSQLAGVRTCPALASARSPASAAAAAPPAGSASPPCWGPSWLRLLCCCRLLAAGGLAQGPAASAAQSRKREREGLGGRQQRRR